MAAGTHTPGDMLVWLPAQRVLFSGGVVYVARLLGVLPMSRTKAWLDTFAAIEALNPERIVPGHGRVCSLDQARRETRDYLVALRSHTKRAGDDGVGGADQSLTATKRTGIPVASTARLA